jgi:hypothetical protein
MEKIITVEALKKLISESSNEFKAKIGPNVESEDKKNNGKAYSDAKKRAEDYDGGLKKELGEEKPDYVKDDANRTTLDYNVDNANEDYKERVHAQSKGYNSVAEMENGIEKTGDFSNNEKIYQSFKKNGKEFHELEKILKKSGLQASKMPEKIFKKGEMYESKEGVNMRNIINNLKTLSETIKPKLKENLKLKTVFFKKTNFLNEEHMASRIPDEFKKDGEQFKMKDKVGNEYIVEWNNNNANVLSYQNKEKIMEPFKKFNKLVEFKSVMKEKTTNDIRLNEDKNVNRMLEIMRNINKTED